MEIAELIFQYTDNLPKKEDFGFTSQIRRAALSISANIAEGFGRNYDKDKLNFYYYSRGSITETMSHLEYGKRVGYLNPTGVLGLEKKLTNLHLVLNKLILSLKSKPKP